MENNKNLETFLQFCPQQEVQPTHRDPHAAVIYTRVSSMKQVERASLESQERLCTELVGRRKWYIMERFGGTYESAKKDDRKEFNRLKKFLFTNKQVSKVVVYSYDRFSRTGLSAADFIKKLNLMGIEVVSATQQVDTSTYTGEFQQNLWLLLGQLDNNQRKEKAIDGTKERLLQGYWPNHTPLGYTNLHPKETCDKHQLVINKDGGLLHKAFQWKASGKYSDKKILEMLNARGLNVKKNHLFKIFRNPFYCGVIVHKLLGRQPVAGKHPALITQELFLQINNVVIPEKGRGGYATYNREDEMLPLKVFMKSEESGVPFTGYMKLKGGREYYYYKIRGKGKGTNKSASFINGLFADCLKALEFKPELIPLLEKAIRNAYVNATSEMVQRGKEAQRQLSEIKNKVTMLEDRYIYGGLEKDVYERHKERLKSEQVALEAELYSIQQGYSTNLDRVIKKSLTIAQNLSKQWVSSNYAEKMQLQKLVFPEGIFYNPENNAVRTRRVNTVFALIAHISKGSGGNKKNNPPQSDGLFPFVGVRGFEPPTTRPPDVYSNRAELHPERLIMGIGKGKFHSKKETNLP